MTLKEAVQITVALCTGCQDPEFSVTLCHCCQRCAERVAFYRFGDTADIDGANSLTRMNNTAMLHQLGLSTMYGWTDANGFWDPTTKQCLLPVEVRSVLCLGWLCDWAKGQLGAAFVAELESLCAAEASARIASGRLV